MSLRKCPYKTNELMSNKLSCKMLKLWTIDRGKLCLLLLAIYSGNFCCDGSMTMKQFQASLDMMRSACQPKFKTLTTEILDGLRQGIFMEDKELKCYTNCIAQMAGTLTKKGDLSISKTIAQLDTMVPADLKEQAKNAILQCKEIQANYKDTCDKTFYITKCAYEKNPDLFMFP